MHSYLWITPLCTLLCRNAGARVADTCRSDERADASKTVVEASVQFGWSGGFVSARREVRIGHVVGRSVERSVGRAYFVRNEAFPVAV